MKRMNVLWALAAAAVLALAGCATDPYYGGQPPAQTTHPATYENPRYGYVESIEVVPGERRTGPGVGAIGGAVAGGLLGHQVGSGSGNTAATIGGAVLGGVVGHQVEQRVRARQGEDYLLRVRMDDGTLQTFRQETHGNIQIGDRVRVQGGTVFKL